LWARYFWDELYGSAVFAVAWTYVIGRTRRPNLAKERQYIITGMIVYNHVNVAL